MYRFDIIAVGRLPGDYVAEGCAEFVKRLSAYAAVTVTELPHTRLGGESPAEIAAAIGDEQSRIMAALPKGAAAVALCVEGRQLDTVQFSDFLKRSADSGRSRIAFVIGGSHGLGEQVKQTAALRLSMSPMTFPHGLARLMLLEQLYRAMSIQNGGKYHK